MNNKYSMRPPHREDVLFTERLTRLARTAVTPREFLQELDLLSAGSGGKDQLPALKDYSDKLTLVRDQDSRGGCFLMAAMAIQDIMKEIECPYAPDASYHFAEYVYNLSKPSGDASPYNRPPDARFPQVSQEYDDLLQRFHYGCCSEASFPTNYDSPHHMDKPFDSSVAEALHYKLQFSHKVLSGSDITEERVKALLLKCPVGVANYYPYHVTAIIGYNDEQLASDNNTGAFLMQNSYGDGWGDNGREWVSYASFRERIPYMSLFWFSNIPSAGFAPHRFTGRIKLKTNSGRRFISVSVGVEGEPGKLVWNEPGKVEMTDSSKNLTIDFALPDYAKNHWPPNEKNQWYVTVHDNSGAPVTTIAGIVEDVVLVERVFSASGKPLPILHRSSGEAYNFKAENTLRIYVPSRKHAALKIALDKTSVPRGENILLSGTLSMVVNLTNSKGAAIPLAHTRVFIKKLDGSDVIEGEVCETFCSLITDAEGKFSIGLNPQADTAYQADAVRKDNTVIASSNVCKIEVEVPAPVPVH